MDFLLCGYPNFCFLPKKLRQKQIKFCLKLAKFVQFGQNIGNIGTFHPIPDHKTMQTMCLGVFFWHFCSFWVRPCWLIWCTVGGLVGGCGAWAVSRKTPIYLIILYVIIIIQIHMNGRLAILGHFIPFPTIKQCKQCV